MGVLASVALCAGTVGAQELPSPDVPDVPSAPVPDLPSVQAPELPPAPVPTPSLPVPSLPTPQPPSAPAPSLPAPQLPEAPALLSPSGGGGGGSSSGSGSGSGSGSTAPGTASGGSGGGGSAAPAAGSARGSAAAPAGAAGSRASGRSARRAAATGGSRRHAHEKSPAAERRLRAKVRRLAGCLGQVREGQRRVLVLRAGLGPRHALSRGQVSRRLELPMPRVRKLERRGVRRLERLAHSGGCGSSGAFVAGGAGADGGGGTTTPRLAAAGTGPLAADAGPAAGIEGEVARSEVKGELERSRSVPPAALVSPRGDVKATDLSLLAAALGIALLAFAVRRELRRT